MKKVIFMGVLGLFLLGSCNSKSGDSHEDIITKQKSTIMTDMTTRDMTTNMRNTTMSTKSRKTMPEEAMKSSCHQQRRKLPA